MNRCPWCLGNDIYEKYHDMEWGNPVTDDSVHFEFLVLESAQAGLSWLTVLKKREAYRRLFANFNPEIVASFNQTKIEELLTDSGIIRNRKKIEAAVRNAAMFLEIQSEFGSFNNYIWQFVDGKPLINHWQNLSQLPCKTELSDRISKDLKKRGFSFLGSTIIYSHLQATGIINDHLISCFRHPDNLIRVQ
ncbi:MAG: DNA-3-methyladenine glycosylase I [Candidatus Wallbacteria bacterium HGW-Wallbacteria-1]|uniref:DNA-3-methyladenine glycosylase I n=1 Tax=Candidatus Wallbacteria bacterium HGW-Wallbacteria-1 TaxID=2013854 RepID=A0A2N1PPZ5_9BACT|nr:MAG: DNA-3-methyladenine glycosylase I [Candidatus Wallbacteria bacterium HGW-Wallbacteria-1]